MAWVVEIPARPAPRRGRAVALLRAEWRQLWWLSPAVLAAGLGVWALLAGVTSRVATDARPEGVVFNTMGSLLLSLFPLLLAAPMAAGLRAGGRASIWRSLPVGRRTVNALRSFGVLVHAWPALLTWPLIVALLVRVYGPTPSWVITNTALVAGCGVILSARTAFAPFLVFMLLPLQVGIAHVVPTARPLAEAWAAAYASPWCGAVLSFAFVALGSWALTARAPRRN